MSDETKPPLGEEPPHAEPQSEVAPEPQVEAAAEPECPPPPPAEPSREELSAASDLAVERELRRLTRRGFITAGAAAVAGYGAWHWLKARPAVDGIQWPFRRVLEMNEKAAMAFFSRKRLNPTFDARDITAARINGHVGLTPQVDAANWRLRIEGIDGGSSAELTLEDLHRFPLREMITELRCIEGWRMIVKWSGVRLADVMAKFPPTTRDGSRPDPARSPERLVRYVAMETPGRGYYVGLDMASALHPQTLLAWAVNDQPLDWHHGAPLRLAIPVKYGIKNIKRLATIRYTDIRPPDFWGERGYDWYAGH
jgi:DMSO/TMAO reductase YedYZ molybdopterin-dependent catalytic subunit